MRTLFATLLFGAATALQFQLPALAFNVPNALLIICPTARPAGGSRGWWPGRPRRRA